MEAFTAEHNVTIEEILYDWPARKFEAMYEAFAKRKVADELSQRRALEIAAVWGNPNMDSEKDTELRGKIMENIDERFSNVIATLYGDAIEEPEIDKDDPFYAAIDRGMEKRKLPES